MLTHHLYEAARFLLAAGVLFGFFGLVAFAGEIADKLTEADRG